MRIPERGDQQQRGSKQVDSVCETVIKSCIRRFTGAIVTATCGQIAGIATQDLEEPPVKIEYVEEARNDAIRACGVLPDVSEIEVTAGQLRFKLPCNHPS
jgi:hypothetical protein